MDILKYKRECMKKIHHKKLMLYGNVFYKSYYIDNAEFRIYRDSNKFKLYVFQNNLMNWVCIGKFDNPRQVVREIEYIVSRKKNNDIRKWFDRDCIEIKYTK